MNATDVKALADGIRRDVARAIIGQDEAVELMLIALLSSGHILLEGPRAPQSTSSPNASRACSGSISGASSSPPI